MTRASLGLALLLGAAGCSSGAELAVRPPSAARSPERPAARRIPENETRPPKPIPVLAAPERATCSLRSGSWSGALRIGAGGPVYGTLSHASTSVHLPEITGDGSAFAVASDARYELRGLVDAPALYTRKATAMSSFVVPFARTPLTWSSVGQPGRVSLGLDVSEVFEGTTAAEVELPCEQVSLDAPSYDARDVLVPKRAEDKWLSGKAELFLVPGTPSLARFKRGGMRAWVLDRARGYSRVVVELPRAYAYGWVDSDHVSVVPYGTGGGGFGRVGGRHFGRSATTCPYPLDLRVEVAGVRAVIGSIRPEGTFRVGEVRGDMRVVDLDARWVTLAPNAELLVRASELDGCSRVPKVVGKS